ncbi:universal stress protein [Streptomyces mirabilis]|uniref:universal stress protein n=1 Tax=Streptomyces mirabilis TaxID=68239 RepID=UPI0021C23335|nr:universal stress protein [Streptomyces mirabilis]MCT9108602.1 universal stress protein [Streptomyces mirabilis]
MTTRHVTVGVDGTLIAVRALDRAAEEAVLRGALLDIVYAVPDLDEAGPVLASAAARVRERHPGLPVTASAFEGGPVQALAQHGRDAELTVIGTRGLGGIAGLLFGSVSLRLTGRSRGPLLVVRGNHRSARRGEVLLGMESDAADAAAYAFAEAARRGVRLSVLDAAASRRPAPAPLALIPADRARDDAVVRVRTEQAVPRRAVAGLRRRYPQVEVEVRTFDSGRVHSLLEATREAAVVVVGAHGHSHRIGPQPGPVTTALLHHSHCPVAIV